MKFIVRFFPEISIKSRPVRKRMVKQLQNNIRRVLRRYDDQVTVHSNWDHLQVVSRLGNQTEHAQKLRHRLARIPGIAYFNQVKEYDFVDFQDAFEKTQQHYEQLLINKTFRVRCKRAGKHEFNSLDVEKYIGGGLNQHCQSAGVKLKDPDVVVMVEIKDDKFFVVTERIEGLGGYPLGCQDTVATLISGGFDSGGQLQNAQTWITYPFCIF